MRAWGGLVVAAWVGGSGCARSIELRPVAATQAVAGVENAAAGEVAGVRVVVEGTAWRGDPSDLWTRVTPVRVTIENQTDLAVRVRYSDFGLIIPGGFELRALPPVRLERPVAIGGPEPAPARGFYLAAPYAPFYPGREVWPEPVELEPYYNEANFLWDASLPTAEMLTLALPEGVVAGHGQVSGYVYFQPLPARAAARATRVTVAYRPSDAHTRRSLGAVEIPLQVAYPLTPLRRTAAR